MTNRIPRGTLVKYKSGTQLGQMEVIEHGARGRVMVVERISGEPSIRKYWVQENCLEICVHQKKGEQK